MINTLTVMKNNSQGINSRAADPKNQNSDLEYRMKTKTKPNQTKTTPPPHQDSKKKKHEIENVFEKKNNDRKLP